MREKINAPNDWHSSVIAVPPLARTADLRLAQEANRRLIRHLEAGGVTTIMCGGNANYYHVAVSEYEEILDFLAENVAPDTWVIPALGPAFGTMQDQSAILARKRFPTAMVLPTSANMTQDGLDRALRIIVETLGYPLVLYVKDENYLAVDRIGRLDRDGGLLFVKYAIVRQDPADDPFLAALIDEIGSDKIISGIGERPTVVHFQSFGLRGFTTGSGCLAPASSARLLNLLTAGDYSAAERMRHTFIELETLRDTHGPAYVLHEAVTLGGIADMGSMLPLMSNLPPDLHAPVRHSALNLMAANDRLVQSGAGP